MTAARCLSILWVSRFGDRIAVASVIWFLPLASEQSLRVIENRGCGRSTNKVYHVAQNAPNKIEHRNPNCYSFVVCLIASNALLLFERVGRGTPKNRSLARPHYPCAKIV